MALYNELISESSKLGGVRSGVDGTPTLFVNGVHYDGDWINVASFAEAIEASVGS